MSKFWGLTILEFLVCYLSFLTHILLSIKVVEFDFWILFFKFSNQTIKTNQTNPIISDSSLLSLQHDSDSYGPRLSPE